MVELEFEGKEQFLQTSLQALIDTSNNLAEVVPVGALSSSPAEPIATKHGEERTSYDLSSNSIAAKLDSSTGPEIAICAVAHLQLCQGKSEVSRQEILAEMKNATNHYKETMSKNLSQILKGLVKSDRLNQRGNNKYALTATEQKSIEVKLDTN